MTILNSPVPTVGQTTTYLADDLRLTLAATVGTTPDFQNTFQHDNCFQMRQVEQASQGTNTNVAFKRVTLDYNDIDQFRTTRRYGGSSAAPALVARTSNLYDDGDRLTSLEHALGVSGSVTLPYTLGYDLDDRLTSQNAQGEQLDYGYDDSHELTAVTSSQGNNEGYDYDLNGNRLGTDLVTGPANRLREDDTYVYHYDAEGNRILRVHKATLVETHYVWDHRNRLTRVYVRSALGQVTRDTTFRYDPMDRRLAKTDDADGALGGLPATKWFVYDGAHIALAFNNGGGLAHRYLHGPVVDQVLADEQVSSGLSPGVVSWPLTDHLGSVCDLLNGSGVVVGQVRYDSFGRITQDLSAAVDFLFGYTGREEDRETGLKYYRARYYDAATGQFVGEDPIEDDSNPYRYVGNGPTNAVDPSGLNPIARFFEPIVNVLSGKERRQERSLIAQTNVIRARENLPPLAVSSGHELQLAKAGVIGVMDGQVMMANGATGGHIRPLRDQAERLRQDYGDTTYAISAGGGVVAREALITAGTLGSAQVIRGGVAAGYGARTVFAARAAQPVILARETYCTVESAGATVEAAQNGDAVGVVINGGCTILGGIGVHSSGTQTFGMVRQGLVRRIPWQYGPTGGGLGVIDKFGNITIKPGLTGQVLEETILHEGVHRFFSPRSGPFREARADLRLWGYNRSHFLRYTEEAIAETFGTGSLRKGLSFPLQADYNLSAGRIIIEGVGYVGIVGGSSYAAYKWASDE